MHDVLLIVGITAAFISAGLFTYAALSHFFLKPKQPSTITVTYGSSHDRSPEELAEIVAKALRPTCKIPCETSRFGYLTCGTILPCDIHPEGVTEDNGRMQAYFDQLLKENTDSL